MDERKAAAEELLARIDRIIAADELEDAGYSAAEVESVQARIFANLGIEPPSPEEDLDLELWLLLESHELARGEGEGLAAVSEDVAIEVRRGESGWIVWGEASASGAVVLSVRFASGRVATRRLDVVAGRPFQEEFAGPEDDAPRAVRFLH